MTITGTIQFLGGAITNSNFTGADLFASEFCADLRNSKWFSSSMRGADMRAITFGGDAGTNFNNCDLTGANFAAGINLVTGVVWNNTVCPGGSNSDVDEGDGQTCLNNLVP